MPTTFRPYQPDQLLLLSPDLREWLPAGHLVHHVSDLVDALDLSAFYAPYEGDGNHESAGKRQGTRTRPGAKHLRTVLIGCAHGAARTQGRQFRAYHKALIVRRGY